MSFLRKASNLLGTAKRQLGEDVVYHHSDGQSVDVKAVWDDRYIFIDSDTEAHISGNNPQFGVQLDDLLAPPVQGDEVEILGRRYKVTDIQEDGQGAAQLLVHRIQG